MKERLKQLRKALGITQEEFARDIGASAGAVGNYERGRNEPLTPIIKAICQKYNVSEDWLRTGAGEMFLPEPEDELDRMLAGSNVIPQFRTVIRQLMALPESDQRKVVDWLRKTVSEMEEEPEVDPIEAEVEAYRAELLAEKEAAAKPSASAESVG